MDTFSKLREITGLKKSYLQAKFSLVAYYKEINLYLTLVLKHKHQRNVSIFIRM